MRWKYHCHSRNAETEGHRDQRANEKFNPQFEPDMLTVPCLVHATTLPSVVEAYVRLFVAAGCERDIYNIKHNLLSNDVSGKLY